MFIRRFGFASAVLLVHCGLILWGARTNAVTVDEAAHIAAGVHHWRTGELGLYRVNPPLVRMIAALPAIAAGVVSPDRAVVDVPAFRPEGIHATALAEANRERYHDIVFAARLPGLLWSLIGALVVWCWASQLFGPRAGLASLTLWCFEPNLIAHAQLVTPDVPATVAGLAATYAFWRYLRRPSWKLLALAAVVLGVAQLTKFTMLVLYPAWLAMWLVHHAGRLRTSWRHGVVHAAAATAISLVVLNAGYGCQGTGTSIGRPTFVSASFTGHEHSEADRRLAPHLISLGNRFADSRLGELPSPVPIDYLRGIDLQRRDFERGFRCYLAGEWQVGGWWYYYLYALAVKLPLGLIGLIAFGIIARGPRDRWAPLVPAVAILAFVSSQTGFTHHVRYVLPVLPFLLVVAGRAAAQARPWARRAGVAVIVWVAASSLRIQPHSLSYFNELAGGPEHGAEHLIDSNIDWGQDLLRLKRWLDQHPHARPLQLVYFGAIDPAIAGIDYILPPPRTLRPGTYAISVNFVRGLRFRAFDGAGHLREIEPDDYAHFQELEPVDRVGYSLLIFEIK